MASFAFNKGRTQLQSEGGVLWGTNTIKAMLLGAGYVADPDQDDMSTAAAAELSISGYTAGFGSASRRTLGSRSITQDNTANRTHYFCSDPAAWTLVLGHTPRMILYKHDTNDATSIPLIFYDLAIPTTGGVWQPRFSLTAGAFYLEG